MTILSWNEQYLIGQATIDEQHKMLFRLVNDFHTHWIAQRDRRDIARVLSQLIRYAELHFQDEEGIMEKEGYPQLDSHHQTHEMLIEEIFKLNEELADQSRMLDRDITKFLKQWLIDHIVHNDYEFRNFLQRKRREARPAG